MRLPAMTAAASLARPAHSARRARSLAGPPQVLPSASLPPNNPWSKGPPATDDASVARAKARREAERLARELAERQRARRELVQSIADDIHDRCRAASSDSPAGNVSWPNQVPTDVAAEVDTWFPPEEGPMSGADCAFTKHCVQKPDGRYAYNYHQIGAPSSARFNYHVYVPACP